MGSLSAASMRAELSDRALLEWHLQYNHYPPIPLIMIDVAAAAIAIVRDDPYSYVNSDLPLPEGVSFRGRTTAPVSEVMDHMHLWDFVGEPEDGLDGEALGY